MSKIAIIGAGGFAKEVLHLLDDLGKYNDCSGFYQPDDVWGELWKDKEIMGLPVLPYSELTSSNRLTIGIGNSTTREKIVAELGATKDYINIIHPSAHVSRWVKMGNGNIITAGSIVTCDVVLGDHCQFNLNTTIGHDSIIGDYFTSAPGVNISGSCVIGKHVYFGTSAATRQGMKVADNIVIGMGAMVVKNLEQSGTYVGIPAKLLTR